MKYGFDSRVRYSEVDKDNRLSITGIVNYFQDCSIFHSEAVGHGVEYLQKEKKGWILSSWQIIVNERPALGEELRVSTWPYKFSGLYGNRNFVISGNQGKIFAYANSIWVYMDLDNRKPMRVEKEELSVYDIEKPLDMEYAPRKIKTPTNMSPSGKFPIRKYQIDTNNHVNNAQYVTMAIEALDYKPEIRELRVEYKQSAVYGDTMYAFCEKEEGKTYIELKSKNGDAFSIAEIKESGNDK